MRTKAHLWRWLWALIGAWQCVASAQNEVTVIHAGTLLSMPGEPPQMNRSVVVADGRIRAIEAGFVAIPGAQVIDLSRSFVMPGMIDAHVHLQYGPATFQQDLVTLEDGVVTLRGYAEARRSLEAGFTSLRDMAGDADVVFSLRDAINRGYVSGPRILAAGPCIMPTGGGVIRGYRREVMQALSHSNLELPCDGPADCARATRQAIKDGADFIKIVVTGSINTPSDASRNQQMMAAEVAAVIEVARNHGKRVAAHAHGLPGIHAAIAAGVDSIEHGSFADADAIEHMRRNGTFLVPTMTAMKMLEGRVTADAATHPMVKRNVLDANKNLREAVRVASRRGVNIVFGTDSSVGMHGANAGEFSLLRAAGMNETDMLRAATVQAARLLGIDQEVGTLEVGKAADVVATSADPLSDIAALSKITFVMKAGEVVVSQASPTPPR